MGETIAERYRKALPGSWARWERARRVIPGGITHDGRHLTPFPLYIDRAAGPRKWDVDGREYIDYWMGHGALFLGHSHPALIDAVQRQVARGTHYGACHDLEVEWAEWITRLIPSAELVRFTMSGTEATHLALRLARAYTGRPKVVKFTGHFHGWHDGVSSGVNPPFDVPMSAGIPGAVLGEVLLAPPNDIAAVEQLLGSRSDIGAVILEPSGGQAGVFPIDPGFLKDLRQLTQDRGTVLIFDEVITGFRYAPGGAQEYYGVTPDMTTLAKIVAGGLPGAAVCGRRDILEPDGLRGRRRMEPDQARRSERDVQLEPRRGGGRHRDAVPDRRRQAAREGECPWRGAPGRAERRLPESRRADGCLRRRLDRATSRSTGRRPRRARAPRRRRTPGSSTSGAAP